MSQNLLNNIPRPVVLDVTLRDGGYLNNWNFSLSHIKTAIQSAAELCADIIEVGYLDDLPGLPPAASCPAMLLKQIKEYCGQSLIAAMVRPSVKNAADVLSSRKNLVDLARIPVDIRNTEPSKNIANLCQQLNIPLTFNLTSVTCFSLEDIEAAVSSLHGYPVAFYIADSRGALKTNEISGIINAIRKYWHGPIGYHAHNNIGLAVKNSIEAIRCGCELIDGSVFGIGLGGRNLKLDDAIKIAANYRNDLNSSLLSEYINENSLGVPAPSREMPVYRLSGQRNVKQEWIQVMLNQLGLKKTELIVRKLPYRSWFDPNELEPFIGKNVWPTIKWY